MSKLGGLGAHAVSTIDTRGGIGVDANTGLGLSTADVAEDVTEALLLEALGGDTLGGLDHAVAEGGVGSRGEDLVGSPVGGQFGARTGGVGGLVRVHLNSGGGGSEDVGLEGVEIGKLGGLSTLVDLDQTIVVLLLVVHVDDTAAEDTGHVVGVEGSGLLENTLGSTVVVATILSEEDGDGVLLEELDLLVVARILHVALTAPGVDVVTPVVDALAIITAVEVLGNLITDILVIVGGIANTQPTLLGILDVLLGITDGSLDESRGGSVGLVVGDLVTGEETDDVGVLGELVDDGSVALVEVSVPGRVVAVDGQAGLGKIGDDVDASSVEELHAGTVVGGGIDGVGSDGVGTEFREEGNISLASSSIGERVSVGSGQVASRTSGSSLLLVSNTLHVKLSTVLVEELGTLGESR